MSTTIKQTLETIEVVAQNDQVTYLRIYGTGPKGDTGDTGEDASEVQFQYSVDGTTWSSAYTSGDIYFRVSTDGGDTWSDAQRFRGEDGGLVAHAETHATSASDELTPGDIGAEVAGAAADVQDNLDTHTTTHPIPTTRDDRNEITGAVSTHADLTNSVHGIEASEVFQVAESVTSLPESSTSWKLYRLTQADDTILAPTGLYIYDGTGWLCLAYAALYSLGNLGAAPSHTLISGAGYIATIDQEITSWSLTLTRPGLVAITLTNAGTVAVAQPTMAGRTQKLLGSDAWDGAATALNKVIIEDDGTYLIVASEELA